MDSSANSKLPPSPNPHPYASVLSLSTSVTSPYSISPPPTSIPYITILSSLLSLTFPSSVACPPPGGNGTSPTPPIVAAPHTLSASSAAVLIPSSDSLSFPSSGTGMVLSCLICTLAWVTPSMQASRPSHSWRLLQAIFA